MNIAKFDFDERLIIGHLVGPDHDQRNRTNMIDVKYKIMTGTEWVPRVHIEFSDRQTSYEQSIGLIEHAFFRMTAKSKELGIEHPFNNNLHGPYLFSAQKRGIHSDFDNVCDYLIEAYQIPASFKESLVEIGYDLQWKGPSFR